MSSIHKIEGKIYNWFKKRRDNWLLNEFKSITKCSWCHQWHQETAPNGRLQGRSIDEWTSVVKCSNCGGEDIYEFGAPVALHRGVGAPPKPKEQ